MNLWKSLHQVGPPKSQITETAMELQLYLLKEHVKVAKTWTVQKAKVLLNFYTNLYGATKCGSFTAKSTPEFCHMPFCFYCSYEPFVPD